MENFSNDWKTLFETLEKKAVDFNLKDYLPIDGKPLSIGYRLSDINICFTITIDASEVMFNNINIENTDIHSVLNVDQMNNLIKGGIDFFQLLVENKVKITGNSKYLLFLTTKNIFIDLIQKCMLEDKFYDLMKG